MNNELGVFLKMGHYYRWIYSPNAVFQAKLCTFCNGKNVTNYNKCIFAGKGEIRVLGMTGCLDQSHSLVEITEQEYEARRLAKAVEEL
jgi:hypothetical protein